MVDVKKEIKYLPVFIVFVCVYFYNVFLHGALLVVEDGFSYYYPMMITMAKQFKSFTFPFWNPLEYSGFPLFASMEPGALYPFNVVLPLLLQPATAYNLNIMLHYALAGFFTFLYARQIGLGTFPAVVSGTVFSLLGFLPAHLNHQSILNTGVWIPLLLYFQERMKNSLKLKYALYASLVVAVQFFGGHPQICFYTYLLFLFSAVFSFRGLAPEAKARFVLYSLLSLVIGWLLALPQIVAAYELAMRGIRADATYEFFASYSFPLHMIPTFLFPFFYYLGGGHAGEMWGTTPIMGQDAFIGTLPFLLSLVVAARWRSSRLILFWGIIAVFAFVLALGDSLRPFNRLLYHLPVYNAFRGHSKLILLVSFAMSILTGFGISFLEDREKGKRFSAVLALVLFSVIAASVIAFTFFQGEMREFFQKTFSHMRHFQMRWDRGAVPAGAFSIRDASFFVPVVMMSLYLVCVLGSLKAKGKAVRLFFLSGILVLICAEALSWKMVSIPRKAEVEHYNRDLYTLLSSYGEGRTVFLSAGVPPLTAMPYGVRLADGYESLETEDYAKIFPRMYLQPPMTWERVLKNNALLSMLNTRYLVVARSIAGVDTIHRFALKDNKGRFVPANPLYTEASFATSVPIYRRIADFSTVSLFENLLVLPRAYSVVTLKAVDSADEFRRMLFSYRMRPWFEAAVSSADLRTIGSERFSSGEVTIREERPDMITLEAKFAKRGFIVLADQFYPGWRAYIDGSRSTIYRTNGVLRGVVVPEGEHTIVFTYLPLPIYACMAVSGTLFFAILYILLRQKPWKE